MSRCTGGVNRRTCIAAALPGPALASQAPGQAVPLALSSGVNAPFVDALLHEFADALGLRWTVVRAPFVRVMRMAEQGEALGFGVSPNPGRESRLVFTQALFRGTVWALSRASSPRQASRVAELKGLEVCAARDASLGEAIDAAAGRQFQLRVANGDFATRLRMLSAGRCDVLLATHYSDDPALLQQRIREAGIDPAQVALGRQPLDAQGVHIAAARGSPLASWVPALNQALVERQAAIARLLRAGP